MYTFYVSSTTADYTPSMAVTIADVMRFVPLVLPGFYIESVEPLVGVYKGAKENSVAVTLDAPFLYLEDVVLTASALARYLNQESVLVVTDDIVDTVADWERVTRWDTSEAMMRAYRVENYSRAYAGNAAHAYLPRDNGTMFSKLVFA